LKALLLLDPASTLTLGLTVGIMAMVSHRIYGDRGLRRSFDVGFAALGWPYLLFGLAPAQDERIPVLWTTEFLHRAYSSCYLTTYPDPTPPVPILRPPAPVQRPGGSPRPGPGVVGSAATRGYWRFQIVGHCLVSLAVATAGGLLACRLAARRNAPAAAPVDESRPADRPSSGAGSFNTIFGTSGRAIPGRNS
jgi:hypothetical protein